MKCHSAFSFNEIFYHIEQNYCELNHTQSLFNPLKTTIISQNINNGISYRECNSNNEPLSLTQKRKSRKRESLIFKNSFIQGLQRNLPSNITHSEKKLKANFVTVGSFESSSQLQVAEEVDILSKYIESSNKKKNITRNYQLKCKTNKSYNSYSDEKKIESAKKQMSILKENSNLKNLLSKTEERLKDLASQIDQLKKDKDKIEKESQSEVKYLLQQIISLKEFNTNQQIDQKTNPYHWLSKIPQQLQNFTLSLSQSHVSLDKENRL